jgi:hypothetical protein
MKVSEMIRQALEKKGLRNLKDASKHLGISPELLRVTINKGHIPKDNTLILIANKLKLDKSLLVLAAHQEKVPSDVKGFFLAPSQSKEFGSGKRKYPLSAEQCGYLSKIMNNDEIQLIRKFRQVSGEAKTQIHGYVDYMYASKKSG